ncbi:MAG TPA: (Fe-S)-binding protein [Candidatus Brocadiia bacterium]|nr:(Fe-S)-binding protein [Candidatus Brocadiia bacterium]
MTPGEFPANMVFLVCFVVAIALFLRTLQKLYLYVRLGQDEKRFDNMPERIKGVLLFVLGQKRVIQETAGVGHFFIFWCFIFLSIGYMESFAQGAVGMENFSYEKIMGFVLGESLSASLYGLFLLVQEILSVVVVAALLISLHRRYIVKPLRLKIDDPHARMDATIIICLILSLLVMLFFMHGLEIAGGRSKHLSAWMPVGNIIAGMFASHKNPEGLYSIVWWLHTGVLLGFMVYIPHSKHMHLLGAVPNIFFRWLGKKGYLPPVNLEDESAEKFGVSEMQEFTWKDILDTYACTECGRCQVNCPAFLTGKPLSPFRMIHRMKLHILERGDVLVQKKAGKEIPEDHPALKSALIGDVIEKEAIEDCTTCRACMEVCPELIEHLPKIVGMRRYQVLTAGEISSEAGLAFRNMENASNPWGIDASSRGDWVSEAGVEVPLISEKPDAEYLYYVGCAGAFDPRYKKVSGAVARALTEGGVSFAILGPEEGCCGDSARRLGNEYLYSALAQQNIETLKNYNVKKVIVSCPHGYNTFKCDYPQLGGEFEVYHHSEILKDLIAKGKLKPQKADVGGKVVYHDSCYLGRYHEIYDAPRDVVKAASNGELVEMERTGPRSFCCGAGGGRMWLEENRGDKKIYMERSDQALKTGAKTIVTACPFCMTMFEDGVKEHKRQEDVKVLDIAELVSPAKKKDTGAE